MTLHLGASQILAAWETGLDRRPLDRALALLWAAGVQGDAAALPLVERDRVLLKLREDNFGARLPLVVACRACGSEQELEIGTSDLEGALPPPEALTLEDHQIRPTTSHDIAALLHCAPEAMADTLRARLAGQELPATLNEQADRLIEAREDSCALVLALTCADCAATWREVLDVVALVWADFASAARRLLQDVADLARVYGWTETDILALSETRRRVYLDLANVP